jgi:hypothetical protein
MPEHVCDILLWQDVSPASLVEDTATEVADAGENPFMMRFHGR